MATRSTTNPGAISTTHVKSYDSKSQPGVKHSAVLNVSVHCSCEGYKQRRECWHVRDIVREVGAAMQRIKKGKS